MHYDFRRTSANFKRRGWGAFVFLRRELQCLPRAATQVQRGVRYPFPASEADLSRRAREYRDIFTLPGLLYPDDDRIPRRQGVRQRGA